MCDSSDSEEAQWRSAGDEDGDADEDEDDEENDAVGDEEIPVAGVEEVLGPGR